MQDHKRPKPNHFQPTNSAVVPTTISSPVHAVLKILSTRDKSNRIKSSKSFVLTCLIAARTTPATTANALNRLLLFQLGLGHAADAGGIEICFFGLDAAETAELVEKKRS